MNTRHVLAVCTLAAALGIGFLILGQGGSRSLVGSEFAFAGTTATSTVLVTSSTPSLGSTVVIEQASTTPQYIVLTTNTTTPVYVYASIVDANGCNDILNGTTSILLYRSAITSSTCFSGGSPGNSLNCYMATAFTATSTCISSTTINTTTTFNVQYFAQPTDASSGFSGQNWVATQIVTAQTGLSGNGDSTHTTSSDIMQTLTGLNVTTSSINYGNVSAGNNTIAVNQITTSTNAGNASTSVQVSAFATLTLNGGGSNPFPTSSQQFFPAAFTYGAGTGLTASPVTVGTSFLLSPTTTTAVATTTYWGLAVPSGTPAGAYQGVNQFTALWHS
jgi:hypothetical protein